MSVWFNLTLAGERLTNVIQLGRFPGDPLFTFRALATGGIVKPDGVNAHGVFLYEASTKSKRRRLLTPENGDYTSASGNYDTYGGELAIVWTPHNLKTGKAEPLWRFVIGPIPNGLLGY